MSPPLLLDTHVLLWWMMDDPQLSAKVRERLAQADQEVPVSAASVWEIAIKTRKGRLHGTRPYLEQHARLHLEWGLCR